MKIKFPATIELKIGSDPEKFELYFSICKNPNCDCNGVNMVLYNENKGVKFFLDFAIESYREGDYSEGEVKIIKALIDFLKLEENNSLSLSFFKRNYGYVKGMAKCRRDAIESFNLGEFLSYREIMWEEDDIEININGKNYLVFDCYCVTPDCPCKSVAMNFFEVVYKSGIKKPEFSFVYNYDAKTFIEPIGISDVQVKNIIDAIPESMNHKFKKRHAKLKKEVEKDIKRKIKEEGFVPNAGGKRKLGRNELCRCGSGIKYKKCCLNKDIEKYGGAITVRNL